MRPAPTLPFLITPECSALQLHRYLPQRSHHCCPDRELVPSSLSQSLLAQYEYDCGASKCKSADRQTWKEWSLLKAPGHSNYTQCPECDIDPLQRMRSTAPWWFTVAPGGTSASARWHLFKVAPLLGGTGPFCEILYCNLSDLLIWCRRVQIFNISGLPHLSWNPLICTGFGFGEDNLTFKLENLVARRST